MQFPRHILHQFLFGSISCYTYKHTVNALMDNAGIDAILRSAPVIHGSAPVILRSAQVIHRSAPVILGSAPVILRFAPVILGPALVILSSAPVILRSAPVILRSAPVILGPAPVILRSAPIILGSAHVPVGWVWRSPCTAASAAPCPWDSLTAVVWSCPLSPAGIPDHQA